MSTPVTPAPASSPIAALYNGLTLRVLGYASAVNLAANGSGMGFKVPSSQTALIAMCILDGFSAAKVPAGVTISYGTVPTTYGELYSAAFGSIVGKGVGSVLVTTPGTDYLSAPTVALTSLDNGLGATAVATLVADGVGSVTVTNPGSGYVVAPTVDFTGAHTILAEAQAVLGTATLLPSNAVIIAQTPGLARLAGGAEVHWAITNAVTGAGTCNITWLGGLV